MHLCGFANIFLAVFEVCDKCVCYVRIQKKTKCKWRNTLGGISTQRIVAAVHVYVGQQIGRTVIWLNWPRFLCGCLLHVFAKKTCVIQTFFNTQNCHGHMHVQRLKYWKSE